MQRLPFTGLRVVDFGWVWAGTLLGHVLADHGAEVIKIESKKRLDGFRLGKVFELGEELEKNPFFYNLNRNKLSITLNISKPEGAALAKELIKKSDIVIENFTPGTMERRGLGYQTLAEIKPDIIMISLSPAGQTGPLSGLVAYAPILSALSGIDSLLGYADERPLGFKHAYADVCASLSGLYAVLVALRYRARTGQGQYIDLSEYESVTSLIGEAIMDYCLNGRVARPQGNRSQSMGPHGMYPCQGEDKWIAIAVKTEEEWKALCHALGDPDWTKDERFADLSKRIANAAVLDRHIAAWTANLDQYEAAQQLQAAGVPATPVLNTDGVFFDPHFTERKVAVDYDHPVGGGIVVYNEPWKGPHVEPKEPRYAPLLGEHNDYVFGEVLGLSPEEIKRLTEQEVIY